MQSHQVLWVQEHLDLPNKQNHRLLEGLLMELLELEALSLEQPRPLVETRLLVDLVVLVQWEEWVELEISLVLLQKVQLVQAVQVQPVDLHLVLRLNLVA